jgi:hypothetical protein
MSDFVFALKMLGITIVLFLVMQIKVGTHTIEDHTMDYIRTSPVVEPLNGVAHGAVKVMVKGYRWASSAFDTNVGKVFSKASMPGSRLEGFHFGRSESYEKAQEKKREQRAESSEKAHGADGESSIDGPTGDEID